VDSQGNPKFNDDGTFTPQFQARINAADKAKDDSLRALSQHLRGSGTKAEPVKTAQPAPPAATPGQVPPVNPATLLGAPPQAATNQPAPAPAPAAQAAPVHPGDAAILNRILTGLGIPPGRALTPEERAAVKAELAKRAGGQQ
jgi:hypothetical protein